jgi:hypothetical protein
MMKYKMILIFCMLCLVVTGSTIAWLFFWDQFPKKTPIRAKQVYLIDQKPITELFKL